MLRFVGMASRFRERVPHRLRRYIFLQHYVHLSVLRCCVRLSVASGPVPDVMGFIPDIAHTASTNKPIRLQRISAFLSPSKLRGIQRSSLMSPRSG